MSRNSKQGELTEYELIRQRRLEEINARFKAAGIPTLASDVGRAMKRGKRKRKSGDDDDYVPHEDDDSGPSVEEVVVSKPSPRMKVMGPKKHLAFTQSVDRRRTRASSSAPDSVLPTQSPPIPAPAAQSDVVLPRPQIPAPAARSSAPAARSSAPAARSSPVLPSPPIPSAPAARSSPVLQSPPVPSAPAQSSPILSTPSPLPQGSPTEAQQPPSSGASNQVRRRGRSTVVSIWNRSTQIYVDYNHRGMPIGENAIELGSFIGSLSRRGDIIPVRGMDWRQMEEHYKERAWGEIWLRFNFPDGENAKAARLMDLGTAWRNYKSKLHDGYKVRVGTDLELSPCFKECSDSDYMGMIRYWNSDEFKKRSSQNTENKSHQEFTHVLGRRSMSSHEDKIMKKKGISTPLPRKELFITSRTNKDGKPMNDAAKEKIDRLLELDAQGPDNYGPHDHLSMVLGPERPGRIRCLSGTTPTSYWRSSNNSEGTSSSSSVVSEALARAREAEERVQQLHSCLTFLASQLTGDALQGDNRAQLQNMLEQFRPSGGARGAGGEGASVGDPSGGNDGGDDNGGLGDDGLGDDGLGDDDYYKQF